MLSTRFFSKLSTITKLYGPQSEIELVVNTDSRTFKYGETFVALHGENFDGFSYVEQVLKNGAKAVIFSSKAGRVEIVQTLSKNYPNVL